MTNIAEVGALIGALCGGGGLTGLVAWLVRRSDHHAFVTTELLLEILKMQGVNTDGLLVSLVCMKNGKCNGDVDEAIAALRKAKDGRAEFLAKESLHK